MNDTHRGAEGSATSAEVQTIGFGKGRRPKGGAEMGVETQRPIGLT